MSIFENETFNAEEHKQESQLLPIAPYKLAATKAEVKNSDDGLKRGIKLEYDVQEGQYQGRKVFEYINLKHPTEMAEKIGKATLGDLCRAIGRATISSENDLIGIPFMANVVVVEGKNGYQDSNKVKKYIPVGAPVANSAATPTTGEAKGPWAASK